MSNSTLPSMTGFGTAQIENAAVRLSVQIRGINARYLDCNFKLPKLYSSMEMKLRNRITEHVRRGKVEVVVSRTVLQGDLEPVVLNKTRFDVYLKIYKDLLSDVGAGMRPEAVERVIPDILRMNDVWERDEEAPQSVLTDDEAKLFEDVFSAALQDFIKSRNEEGVRLTADIQQKFALISSLVLRMKSNTTAIEQIREKLQKKMHDLLGTVGVDEARLAQEIVLLVDKSATDEEFTRLESHLSQVPVSIAPGNGKRLEFLLQEILRECNTIASKSSSAAMSQLVVDAKVEIEKIREQLQNVE